MTQTQSDYEQKRTEEFVLQQLSRAGLTTTLTREDVRQLIQGTIPLLREYVRLMPEK